jgi:hypothetical protein
LIAVNPTTNDLPTPIAIQVGYDLVSISNAEILVDVQFLSSTDSLISQVPSTVVTTVGTGTLSVLTTMPANAAYVVVILYGSSLAAGNINFKLDGIMLTTTLTEESYFDGDSPGYEWTGEFGQSPSVQLVEPEVADNTVVIDGVIIDPITPNMACNIYYSQDDSYTSDNMTETDWEQKLWTRIPEIFILTQNQQYVFPAPIVTKYLKFEFTNLQSQSYNPGNFTNPVQYKKFPTWVANFFIAQVALDPAIAGQVNVQYNALDFAYDYYLDDIDQSPNTPSAPPTNSLTQLTNYFTPSAADGQVDATTLSQINLVMNQFSVPTGTIVDNSTMLGQLVSNLTQSNSSTSPTTAEGGSLTPIDYSLVSTLSREPVLFEQSLPVMYFFITCRHTYKVLSATFDYNRAYFAGIASISCLRNNYTVPDDTAVYTEPGVDPMNINTQDWIVDPATGIWSTYAA